MAAKRKKTAKRVKKSTRKVRRNAAQAVRKAPNGRRSRARAARAKQQRRLKPPAKTHRRRNAAAPKKTRKNARRERPSLLATLFPIADIDVLAKGAAADIEALSGSGKRKTKTNPKRKVAAKKRKAKARRRNGKPTAMRRKLRPIQSAVPVRNGKGSRRAPYRRFIGAKKRRRRRNSAEQEGADRIYTEFHGRAPSETLAYAEQTRSRAWLGGLGKLVELVVLTPVGTYAIEFEREEDAPMLASSPDGRQLYIVGGDQAVDLDQLGMDGPEWKKDKMSLGFLQEVTYQTEKEFHDFELIDYYHELGEVTNVLPTLVYDTLNRKLEIVGGQYEVRPEGITN